MESCYLAEIPALPREAEAEAAPLQPSQSGAGETLAAAAGSLAPLLREHRWGILLTYSLFNMENLGRLAQPWFLGWAVNDLLAERSLGLAMVAIQYLVVLALSAFRQICDTRVFSRIYAELATRLVDEQRSRNVELSRLAARSALSREMVDFFERDVPVLFYTLYSVVGSLIMISLFDSILVVPCLVFLVSTFLLACRLAKRTLVLNRGLNDQIEQEVDILQHSPRERVEGHYQLLRGWRIGLCNVQALNFVATEGLALILLGVVLVRACRSLDEDVGALFSLLGYVVILTSALGHLPLWVQQMSRLRDICRRLKA
jgi:ABC transporter transmembrane region